LNAIDEAIRRRFHLVPFTVTIKEPDTELPDMLRAEWPGILAWTIEGCGSWLEEGLNPPAAVQAATAAYLSDEDTFAQWVEECCVTEKGRWGIGARLWRSWTGWAEVNKELPGSRKAFAGAMAAHGHPKEKNQGVRGYGGIDLKSDERSRATLIERLVDGLDGSSHMKRIARVRAYMCDGGKGGTCPICPGRNIDISRDRVR